MIIKIRHTGLVVADLDLALNFWRDLLGFNIDKKMDLKENPDKGVYVKDLTTRIVKSIPEIE